MIQLYLEVMQSIFILASTSFLIWGGLLCDGPMFNEAQNLMWIGLVALIGVLACQGLKRLR